MPQPAGKVFHGGSILGLARRSFDRLAPGQEYGSQIPIILSAVALEAFVEHQAEVGGGTSRTEHLERVTNRCVTTALPVISTARSLPRPMAAMLLSDPSWDHRAACRSTVPNRTALDAEANFRAWYRCATSGR